MMFILTIYSSTAYCCDVDIADGTDTDYKSAKTIMLVNFVNNGKEQYFISKQPWPKIKIEVGKSCGFFDFRTGDMVFSSRETIDKLMSDKNKIHVGNGSFRNVNFVTNYIDPILEKDELPEGHPNHFWKYCIEDSICVNTVGRCGERVGINKINLTRFENYLKKKKEYKCSKSSDRKISSCVDNFCS